MSIFSGSAAGEQVWVSCSINRGSNNHCVFSPDYGPPAPIQTDQISTNVNILQDVSATYCVYFPPLSPPPSAASLPLTTGCSTAPPWLHTAVLVTMAANSQSFFSPCPCVLMPCTLTHVWLWCRRVVLEQSLVQLKNSPPVNRIQMVQQRRDTMQALAYCFPCNATILLVYIVLLWLHARFVCFWVCILGPVSESYCCLRSLLIFGSCSVAKTVSEWVRGFYHWHQNRWKHTFFLHTLQQQSVKSQTHHPSFLWSTKNSASAMVVKFTSPLRQPTGSWKTVLTEKKRGRWDRKGTELVRRDER